MNEAGAIVLVILSVALILGSIFFLNIYFRYRARSDAQGTIRVALEKGQPLSPEVLARLMDPTTARVDRRQVDLRRGVIATALGLGIGTIGVVAAPMWQHGIAIGAVPFFVGVAYLALWALGPKG
jgi:O-acetylhomoserine/O-acetylserine sulfhydrylase-like pyridoxal-dependent enzyme